MQLRLPLGPWCCNELPIVAVLVAAMVVLIVLVVIALVSVILIKIAVLNFDLTVWFAVGVLECLRVGNCPPIDVKTFKRSGRKMSSNNSFPKLLKHLFYRVRPGE